MTDSIDKTQEENKVVSEDQQTNDESLAKAMAEYKSDMFKYKERMKSAENELKTLQQQKQAMENAQLEKNEEWKTLYEREKEAKLEAISSLENKSKQFVDSSKINAVVQEIGGFKKQDYVKFIKPEAIDVTEHGSLDVESLQREVNRIKQEYPELLKSSSSPKLPNGAPSDVNVAGKKINNLNRAELLALYSKTKKKS